MKKKLLYLGVVCLALVLLIGIFSLNKEKVNEPSIHKDVIIEGSIFNGESLATELSLDFDYQWIITEDNRKYQKDLAKASAILSADAYFREKDLAKNTQNRVLVKENDKEYSPTLLLEELGFTDVLHIESFKEKSYDFDSNDSITMNLGYKNVDGKYDVFVVVIRGCFSSGEWTSIFDVGAECDNYKNVSGDHPEWTNLKNHKGMDVASNRAMEFINEYIEAHDVTENKNYILLTGHSRGGAIANILGAQFEKENKAKAYTYTFNTPAITLDSEASKYQTIFNIFDINDFYTDYMPFENDHFVRYGKDISVSIVDQTKIKEEILSVSDQTELISNSQSFLDEYKNLFGKVFTDRTTAYETDSAKREFDLESDAVACLDQYKEWVSTSVGLGLEDYFSFSDVSKNNEGKYEFTYQYSKAAILTGFSKILIYGEVAGSALEEMFNDDIDVVNICQLLVNNLSQMTATHVLLNSYCLADNK